MTLTLVYLAGLALHVLWWWRVLRRNPVLAPTAVQGYCVMVAWPVFVLCLLVYGAHTRVRDAYLL